MHFMFQREGLISGCNSPNLEGRGAEHPAVDPPGDCHSEDWFMYPHVFLLLMQGSVRLALSISELSAQLSPEFSRNLENSSDFVSAR
jgi:hypothetical protein